MVPFSEALSRPASNGRLPCRWQSDFLLGHCLGRMPCRLLPEVSRFSRGKCPHMPGPLCRTILPCQCGSEQGLAPNCGRGPAYGHSEDRGMERLQLGTTDLVVSRICYGGAGFGAHCKGADLARLLNRYRDRGGNFLDTAHCYSLLARSGCRMQRTGDRRLHPQERERGPRHRDQGRHLWFRGVPSPGPVPFSRSDRGRPGRQPGPPWSGNDRPVLAPPG